MNVTRRQDEDDALKKVDNFLKSVEAIVVLAEGIENRTSLLQRNVSVTEYPYLQYSMRIRKWVESGKSASELNCLDRLNKEADRYIRVLERIHSWMNRANDFARSLDMSDLEGTGFFDDIE